jgi:CRISPR system Cascade subunit CasD
MWKKAKEASNLSKTFFSTHKRGEDKMPSFLSFHLYGPMASWGSIAIGEIRATGSHPSKAAVIGLLASALGIPRSEDEKIRNLSDHYAYAAAIHAEGSLLTDFHTAQIPKGKDAWKSPTRQQEIADRKNLLTRLSYRDYLCDSSTTVMVWANTENPPYPLQALKEALHSPIFQPFLGRKSCPPSLPLHPLVFEAHSLYDAFLEYQKNPTWSEGFLPIRPHPLYPEHSPQASLFFGEGDPEKLGFPKVTQQRYPRWDAPHTPLLRRYQKRDEWMITLPSPKKGENDNVSV